MKQSVEVPDGMGVCLNFALARPVGTDRQNIAELLREVAAMIENCGFERCVVDLGFERIYSVGAEDESEEEPPVPMVIVYADPSRPSLVAPK